MSSIANKTAVITRVVRYVDVNTHVPAKMWDTDKGMSQRMYAVWLLDEDANTMVSFIKRSNKGGLAQAVRDGMDEVYGGRTDANEFDLGTVVNIKSAKIKKRYPAGVHNGERLPERDVLTHVTLS